MENNINQNKIESSPSFVGVHKTKSFIKYFIITLLGLVIIFFIFSYFKISPKNDGTLTATETAQISNQLQNLSKNSKPLTEAQKNEIRDAINKAAQNSAR